MVVVFLDKGLIRKNLYSRSEIKRVEEKERLQAEEEEKKKIEESKVDEQS